MKHMERLRRFCICAALGMALALVGALALGGLGMTAVLRAPETVRYAMGGAAGHLLGMALMVLAALGLARLFARFARIRLTAVTTMVWALLAAAFLLGCATRQEVDFAYVCEAAERFAQGAYGPLTSDYFSAYSYQLGTCLMLEVVLRLLPGVDIQVLMQGLNVLMSVAAAGMLAALGQMIFEDARVCYGTMALYLLSLPMALYSIHVYGTLPMLMFSAAAMLCFALYIRTKRRRYGLLYALCAALAYMVKPNAAIVVLALLICAALYAMESRDVRPLGFAVLSAVGAVALARLAVAQYEWRSGMVLRENVSMLARLVMGLQDGSRAAGWYNGYTEQFFPAAVSAAQERATASADLAARLQEMAADPAGTLRFFAQKAVSQWLEPTYGTLLYGNYCRQIGPLAEAAQAVFSEQSALRLALEGVMKAWQQALYLLSALGLLQCLRMKRRAVLLILPVTVLGGFLYHMIFEAKSQYIFVYAMYLIPLAALGLVVLGDGLSRLVRRFRKS